MPLSSVVVTVKKAVNTGRYASKSSEKLPVMGKYTTSCYAYMYKACYNVARSENCTRLQTRAHDNCSCSCETGLVKPNATILKVCLIWALSERHHVEAFATKNTAALACDCDQALEINP